MCKRVESYLALITQEQVVDQKHNANQPANASHPQRQGDCSFMNHQVEDHCHVNQASISQNTRTKKRTIDDAIPPLPS